MNERFNDTFRGLGIAFMIAGPAVGLLAFKDRLMPATTIILVGSLLVGLWANLQKGRPSSRPWWKTVLFVAVFVGIGFACGLVEQMIRALFLANGG